MSRLTKGDATVTELHAPFNVSQRAISRHPKVLEQAGLISRRRQATTRLSHLEPEPLREVTIRLASYRECWEASHDRLDGVFAKLQGQHPEGPINPDLSEGGIR